jgi:hypothetical protein
MLESLCLFQIENKLQFQSYTPLGRMRNAVPSRNNFPRTVSTSPTFGAPNFCSETLVLTTAIVKGQILPAHGTNFTNLVCELRRSRSCRRRPACNRVDGVRHGLQ